MAAFIENTDLLVERLEPYHQKLLPTFRTASTELCGFLEEDALKDQDIAVSTTYLWFYREPRELVAYITLLADSLRIQGLNSGRGFWRRGCSTKACLR